MINDGDEQALGELEGRGELLLQLPHAVHPLHEHRRPVRVRVALVAVPYALHRHHHHHFIIIAVNAASSLVYVCT